MFCKEYKNLKGGLILCIVRPRKHKKSMKKREKTPAAYLLCKEFKGSQRQNWINGGDKWQSRSKKIIFLFIYYR